MPKKKTAPIPIPPSASTPQELIPTRESLLRRLKDWNDAPSWEDFFNIYWRLIYTTASKAGLTDAEAQDAVQETIVSVARNIKGFKVGAQHGSFKAWLLQLTRWRITDQFRKRGPLWKPTSSSANDPAHTSTTDRLPDPASLDLDAYWEEEWEQNLLATAMQRVRQRADPIQFQLFQLHVTEQWPARKVAERLNVKLSQVYFAKYRITRLIRKEVKELETQLF